LQRVTVSLDALDNDLFRQLADADWQVQDVLDGISAAQDVGLGPIKVNMVVQRGVNDHQILPMAQHFRGTGVELRFIEFMDVGQTNGWSMAHVLPSAEVHKLIHAQFPLVSNQSTAPGVTAQEWDYADGQGRVGLISSVTQAFCGDCTRMRLALRQSIEQVWSARTDRYSQLRGQTTIIPIKAVHAKRIEMSYIGG
ncbi:MAG: molybdenum cofactor biosynthesis protein, partial [Pseudomonadota bacterium]